MKASDRTPAADDLNVLFCANHCYFRHTAVAAVSLAESSRCPRIYIHVMTCDNDVLAEAKLTKTLAVYSHVVLRIYHVSESLLSTVFVDRYLTKETYLRFLAADVLSPNINRVIYIDSDVVVLDDIQPLSTIDLRGRAVGAVAEFDWTGAAPETRLTRLGIPLGHTYVNAGLLVIDLDRWRSDKLTEQLFDYIAQYGPQLEYHDQDALNAVLQDNIQLIDRRWNLQALMYTRWVKSAFPAEYRATKEARARPGVIHYTTREKPWAFRAWVRKKDIYFRFLKKTAWRHDRPPLETRMQRVEYDLARNLLTLGVDVYAAGAIARHLRKVIAEGRRRLVDVGAAIRTAPGPRRRRSDR